MKLSEKRIFAGLQQKEVMKDVGLYSKIENGKALAVEEDCKRFAELFGCELPELFEEKELDFFKRLLKAESGLYLETATFAEREPKIVSAPICKPVKRHIELVRKCYRLNRTRNEQLKRIIAAEGFRTEQDWYSYIVDQEIEKTARSGGTEQGGSPIMLHEHYITKTEDLSNDF